MFTDYTIVCGVDKKHLNQLRWVYPTWIKSKPSLLKQPMLLFYDQEQLTYGEVSQEINHPDITIVPWPPGDVVYEGISDDKWYDPQRYKMLAGFVHVPHQHIATNYWLKLDTDTVATGQDDWIDESWFENSPAIVSQPWSFTKPANQMLLLDGWLCLHPSLKNLTPLNLIPKEGSDRLGHKRIISWCGFFKKTFTEHCSQCAMFFGEPKLPVPSQDGYMWYMAQVMGMEVKRVQMKSRGWEHWTTDWNIRSAVERVMYGK